MPYYNRDPKRDRNFDNHPYGRFLKLRSLVGSPISCVQCLESSSLTLCQLQSKGLGFRVKPLKRGYIGDYMGDIIGVIKGDARSLDYGSCIATVLGRFRVWGCWLLSLVSKSIGW